MGKSRDFQGDIKESAHKIWLAGLGALSAAEDEGTKLFKNLVKRGEAFESRSREHYADVKDKVEDATEKVKDRAETAWDKMESRLDDAVSSALGRLGVPTRDEIATLTRRVEELTAVVEKLKPAKRAPAKKAPTKKAPAKKAPAKASAAS